MSNDRNGSSWLIALRDELRQEEKQLYILQAGLYSQNTIKPQQEIVAALSANYNKLLTEGYIDNKLTPAQVQLQNEVQLKTSLAKAEKEIADQLERQLNLMKEIKAHKLQEAAEIAAATYSTQAYR